MKVKKPYRTMLQKVVDIMSVIRDNKNCIISRVTRLSRINFKELKDILNPLESNGFIELVHSAENDRGRSPNGKEYNLTPGGLALLKDLENINNLGLKI